MSKISVCIPNYNYAEYLPQCLDSVRAQGYSDLEVLIQDDCSGDASEAVVRGFDDPRISFAQNPRRLGLVGNWNACIDRARGEFVLILHADDYLLPGMLQAHARVLDNSPDIGMTFSAVQLVDAAGQVTRMLQPFDADMVWDRGDFVSELLAENFVRTPSVLVRRKVYERLGGFNPKLAFTPDWEMWLRIAAKYGVAYLAKPFAAYREHARNATREFRRRVVDLQDQKGALDIFFQEHPGFEEQAVDAFNALGSRAREQVLTCLRAGDAEHAIGYAQLAAELDRRVGGMPEVTAEPLAILAEQGAQLGRAHEALEKWALELEAELKRRDAVPTQAPSRLKRALDDLRRPSEA